jgi:hypothetical protein
LIEWHRLITDWPDQNFSAMTLSGNHDRRKAAVKTLPFIPLAVWRQALIKRGRPCEGNEEKGWALSF